MSSVRLSHLNVVIERHVSSLPASNAKRVQAFAGAVVLIGFLLSHASDGFYDATLLSVSHFFTLNVWRLATHVIVGKNLIVFGWTITTLIIAPNSVATAERSGWPLVRFLAAVQLISAVAVSALLFILYVLTKNFVFLFDAPIAGAVPMNVGVLLLIHKHLPDAVQLTTPAGRLKNRHLAGCTLLASLILWLFGLLSVSVPLQVAVSIQAGFVWLRFVEPSENDDSAFFAWASLFPARLQPTCTVIGRICFRLCVRLGLLQRRVRTVTLDGFLNQPEASGLVLPTTGASTEAEKDAERRRLKALRELTDRLNSQRERISSQAVQWDDEEEGGGGGVGLTVVANRSAAEGADQPHMHGQVSPPNTTSTISFQPVEAQQAELPRLSTSSS